MVELDSRVIAHMPWSVSKADALIRCPSLYYRKYMRKLEESTKHPSSKVGSAVHSVLEHLLLDHTRDVRELCANSVREHRLTSEEQRTVETKLSDITSFVSRIRRFKEANGVTKELMEHKCAIGVDFNGVPFQDNKKALLRGVLDHMMITKDNIAIVIDHKTGRKKAIQEHATQFFAYMLLVAANFDVAGVQCAINYVGDEQLSWFKKPNGDAGVWLREDIYRLRTWLTHYLNTNAHELSLLAQCDEVAEAKTSQHILCGWCGYLNDCPDGQEFVAKRAAKKGGSKADL